MQERESRTSVLFGGVIAAVTIGVASLGSCADDPAVDEKTSWCRHFDVVGYYGGGSEILEEDAKHCVCATSQPSAGAIEASCLEEYYYGDGVECDAVDSIFNDGDCNDPEDPTTGGPPDPTGFCDSVDECFNGDGDCCNPDTETDCCCIDQLTCAFYDFTRYPFHSPLRRMNLASSLAGSSIDLVVASGTADESSDSSPVTGVAGYSFKVSCGESECPFILGAYEFDATDPLVVNVKIGGTTKQKTVSNLNVRLAYPALGMHTPSLSEAELPAQSMVFLVEFDLSGAQFGSENGHYVTSTRNESAMTATTYTNKTWIFDDLEFDLTDIAAVDVSVEFDATMTLTDTSPVASASRSQSCSGSTLNVTLTSTTTDGDNDLAVELWWVDGDLEHVGGGPFTVPLANGTHYIEQRAFDLRGGYESKLHTITASCP